MGWIKSSPFFFAATETRRDIIDNYANTPIGNLPAQKFENYAIGDCPKPFAGIEEHLP